MIKFTRWKEYSAELKNTKYLILERIYRFIMVFITNMYVIKYLGPENFGLMAFAASLMSIAAVFCSFGINTTCNF